MRVFLCILAVFAMLVSGIASAMHVHSNVGSTSTITHGTDSPGDSGSNTASHAAICHACAHASPSPSSVGRVVTFPADVDRPLVRETLMALGGAWPPLAEPPR